MSHFTCFKQKYAFTTKNCFYTFYSLFERDIYNSIMSNFFSTISLKQNKV